MSLDDLWIGFKVGFLPIAVVIISGALFVYLTARFIGRLKTSGQLIFIVAFGALGGFLGYSAGASAQSIIGTVLPTLLTLVTLLLGYIFSKESLPHLKPLIPYCILVLVLNAFLGLFIGGRVKIANEEFDREYNKRLLYYERVELEVEKQKKLKELESGQKK